MENASKALIISGGILIGILIAALFAYEMVSISQTGKSYKQKIDMEDALEFNSQFTKYLDQELTAHDVVTIINFAIEWNEKNPLNTIDITEIALYGDKIIKSPKTTNRDSINQELDGNMETFFFNNFGLKERLFILSIEEYDENGRINKIRISSKEGIFRSNTIFFDANGGSVSSSRMTVIEGRSIRSLSYCYKNRIYN